MKSTADFSFPLKHIFHNLNFHCLCFSLWYIKHIFLYYNFIFYLVKKKHIPSYFKFSLKGRVFPTHLCISLQITEIYLKKKIECRMSLVACYAVCEEHLIRPPILTLPPTFMWRCYFCLLVASQIKASLLPLLQLGVVLEGLITQCLFRTLLKKNIK